MRETGRDQRWGQVTVTEEREMIHENFRGWDCHSQGWQEWKIEQNTEDPTLSCFCSCPSWLQSLPLSSDFTLFQFFYPLQFSLTSLEGKVSKYRRYYLYPNAHRQNRKSVWEFPMWSWHQRHNGCCGISLKSLILLTMLKKLWWDRDYLKHQHFSFIWDPCGFLLLCHCSCHDNSVYAGQIWCAILPPPPHQANSRWILPQPAHDVSIVGHMWPPPCHHVCSTLTITQSGQKRYKRGDPVISSWAHGWEQHVHLPAHGCAWRGGWAHLKHVRLSVLFSLVESQECQYVWQWVCKVMVFLLGEESKKSSLFLLIVWAQGVYLLVDVIQWIFSDDVFAQRGSSREETV